MPYKHHINNLSTLLQTTALDIGYPGNQQNRLFSNLTISLKAGELVCFMGPNGVGKSTLLRTLAGLQKPLQGSITLQGEESPSKHIDPEQIAVVLTDKLSAPHLSVYELIAFGRYPYLNWSITLQEKDKAIIEQAIDHVHIRHLTKKSIAELSDGQLQMVMIARALAQQTTIILLDEPTAHLDLNNRVEIMRLLKKLAHTTGKAILVATHELDLALQLADVIWLAGKNNNILSGIPEDLVLTGAFDDIFQFKGFDLKTGKVQHEINRKATIQLHGSGYEYLWTKNALERNGFKVTTEVSDFLLTHTHTETLQTWVINKSEMFYSLEALLLYLHTHETHAPQVNK